MQDKGRWGFTTQTNSNNLPANQYGHYFPNNWAMSLCGKKPKIQNSNAKRKSRMVFVYDDDLDFPYSKCKHCQKMLPFFLKTGTTQYEIISNTYHKSQIDSSNKQVKRDYDKLDDGFIIVPEGVNCSKPGCKETGGTFIKIDERLFSQDHFCISHNPRIKILALPRSTTIGDTTR